MDKRKLQDWDEGILEGELIEFRRLKGMKG